MTTETYAIVALAIVVGACATAALVHALRVIRGLRGPRVVMCPDTGLAVGVRIDLRHAIKTGLRRDAPCVRLSACSRWVERGRCDERCARQAADPASTPRAIVTRGMTGQPCSYCGRRIESVAFLDHYAAFLQPDGSTIEWPHVPPERLPETIAARPPVCWDCHIAETFRRTHPELVTDRPWPRG
jgi:hypothetical protein